MNFSDVIAEVGNNTNPSTVALSANHSMIRFAQKTLEEVAKQLPERLGINPIFCPKKEDVGGGIFRFGKGKDQHGLNYDYHNELHYLMALPMASAVRWLLDGKGDHMEMYGDILRENAYMGHRGETLHQLLCREEALAFCAGMDDRWYRRPMTREANIAESEEACPGFGEDYERGRLAMLRCKRGSRIRNYLSFGIVTDFTETTRAFSSFSFMVNVHRNPYPPSDTRRWLSEFAAHAGDTPQEVAERVLDAVSPRPEEKESPRMGM